MATNLALGDALIEHVRKIGHHKTRKAAVTSARRECIERGKPLQICDLEGQVPFDEDYDYKPLRQRKRVA